jgi:hypothetical protein
MEDLFATNSIRLWSGKYLDLDNITPQSFELTDVIVGLSRELRWGNQSKLTVSVGQHTLHCYSLYPTFKTLLHDAPEGLLGDVQTSVKRKLPQYQKWERELYHAMCEKWCVSHEGDPRVQEVDERVLRLEWHHCVLAASQNFPYDYMNETEVSFQLKHLFNKHIDQQIQNKACHY